MSEGVRGCVRGALSCAVLPISLLRREAQLQAGHQCPPQPEVNVLPRPVCAFRPVAAVTSVQQRSMKAEARKKAGRGETDRRELEGRLF